MNQYQQDKSFDLVELKYLNFDNVKSVIFTKLEFNISQRRACMTNKIDSGTTGNLMHSDIQNIVSKVNNRGIGCHIELESIKNI